ncbi:D-arabinose 1-dehydrogenase-like Zn-dependent alcohol dehydrogenase [Neorhizobium galegae]|nr:D-arabinose 1-dehydrogenase-like Zn-dependent alcohol dehydrogenase [Neorhizobium galegae]MDQ0138166.1 D-arabinose 1-dehydrogenase-like Zn-dependent alcohol dehydrogenase [Neorhizobium galegae]
MVKTMKAAVVHEVGKPLAIECVPVPVPGPVEILDDARVCRHSSVCSFGAGTSGACRADDGL